jgi:mono/diheme cytochrome c family protein
MPELGTESVGRPRIGAWGGGDRRLALKHKLMLGVIGAMLASLLAGCTADKQPSKGETTLANAAKDVVIPLEAGKMKNPLPETDEVLSQGQQVFLGSCALCHGTDGRGGTSIGSHMDPPAADLTSAHVQHWNDGELFWIIQNGVRLTGMPSWKSSVSGDDTWKLARFIHNLPRLGAASASSTAVGSQAQAAISAQDKYTLKIPNGLAFSEFRGYEDWQSVSVSHDGNLMALILANPVMIDAYRAGAPGNGKSFPDGSKMAKVHFNLKKMETFPAATVPDTQHDVDLMVKDSKRFQDSGGWGYGVFEYDAASGNFRLGNSSDKPPQANDAKCGFACHTIVKTRDYVFTDYGHR